MKNSTLACVFLCFTLVQYVTFAAKDEIQFKRDRKSGISAMSPMLRVGRRSGPTLDLKRPKLFYRMGRRDWLASPEESKRETSNSGSTSGMWFGPRLGRVQKRATADPYSPWTYVILNEGRQRAPKLAADSDEILAYEMDEEAAA